MARILNLRLDDFGSDVRPLRRLFCDGTGDLFRAALGRAFALAQRAVAETPKGHTAEIWDSSVQRALDRFNEDNGLGLASDVNLLLEKSHNRRLVWMHGVKVFSTQTKGRLWTLPDGLLQQQSRTIAFELDHGRSLGDWASKLLKAIRSAASPRINGVLFCYATPKDTSHWFKNGDFTSEFRAIIEAGFEKRIGIVTVGARQLEEAREGID